MDFAYWFFVFLTGFLAQYCISIQDFFLGLFLYGAAGAGAFCLIIRNQISGIDQPEGNTPQHPFEETGFGSYTSNSSIRFDSQWLFLILAIASWISCITFIWKGTKLHLPDYMGWGLYAWIGFIFIAITSLYKIWLPFIRRFAWREWLPLGYLLLFSILAGIFHLSSIPATVHGDEGMVGLHARRILEGQISSFFTLSWYEIPQFFFFIPACTMKIFGDSLFGLRMSAVLIGTASLIPFYLLVKDWWGKKAAVFGGILLITNHWFLFLSHSGVNYVQNCFFCYHSAMSMAFCQPQPFYRTLHPGRNHYGIWSYFLPGKPPFAGFMDCFPTVDMVIAPNRLEMGAPIYYCAPDHCHSLDCPLVHHPNR